MVRDVRCEAAAQPGLASMNHPVAFAIGILVLVLSLGVIVAFLWRWLRRSRDDPKTLIGKWVISVPVFVAMVAAIPVLGPFGPFLIVACAIVLSILWAPNIGAFLVSPLTNALDGGTEVAELKPLYSIVRSKLKLGKPDEALAALQQQLEKFPNDFEGMMLLAEIQAEHRHDLPTAELTVHRIANTPDRRPGEIAGAFYALTDWFLRLAHDTGAARQALEQICQRLPNSEWASQAAQRIAHLATADQSAALRHVVPIAVPPGVHNLGLLRVGDQTGIEAPDPEIEADRLVAHLGEHPLDTAARENLASLYALRLGRFEQGIEQLEYLVQLPHQPARNVVRWLNAIADLQVQFVSDVDAPRKALQRIVDLFPEAASAEQARRRLAMLAFEFKGKVKSQPVRLGSYEQNIGLKHGSPPTAT
jgi:tetratricopeptide (TPR) repeat protein